MIKSILSINCTLPDRCSIQQAIYEINQYGYEKTLYNIDVKKIKCKSDRGFKFTFFKNDFMLKRIAKCSINIQKENLYEKLEIEWPRNRHELLILDKSFDVANMLAYLRYFYYYFEVYFYNVRGFDIDLSYDAKSRSTIENNPDVSTFLCVACRMDFYSNGKLIKSCEDIFQSNYSTMMSIFQMKLNKHKEFALVESEYETNLCPLVFENAEIYHFYLIGLVDSFYKKNVLTFTNDVFTSLNSSIYALELNKVENIHLDLNLLNPSVFYQLNEIFIYGSLKSIDKSLFTTFPYLKIIHFHSPYFRKLIHESGMIDWIHEINKNQSKIDVGNLSQIYEIDKNEIIIKFVAIECSSETQEEPLFKVFPDEDFCIYKDFPFDQLVVLIQFCDTNELIELTKTDEFTCTYLWLNQYLEFYNEYYTMTNITTPYFMKKILESKRFRERSKCNFEQRSDLCNKTNFKIGNIWSTIDYYLLNKRLQSAFKITSYVISLIGLSTNLLTVIIILIKSNSDLFKGLKQYTYLCINSVFCLMILVINILSWTTECFHPFEAFCPEIRKLVFIQFFKIIFKECLTTTFCFMLNFSYVAFALNRIAIIKKEQSKFFQFVSDMPIKMYIAVTIIISAGLSVMKYFKYEVNYEYPFMNYPISNEWDIMDVNRKKSHVFDDAYYIVNSISDIINYILFVLVTLFIDIYMSSDER